LLPDGCLDVVWGGAGLVAVWLGSAPLRGAITGIVGYAASSSRIRGSTASTIDPAGPADTSVARRWPAPPSPCCANTPEPAIALIGMPFDRCNRRISAQSSTLNTLLI
jgi:hypothetical protein